jgi:cytidine deaminase
MTVQLERAVIDTLRAAADEAMHRAYAPYSSFRVGAALLGDDGSVTAGCNVENASFGATICAERAAVASAVARGVKNFAALVLVTEAVHATPPCGVCRQVLVEFAPQLPVVSFASGGAQECWTLAELLPHPFNPASLEHT